MSFYSNNFLSITITSITITMVSLAKWLSLQTKWLWVRVPLQSLKNKTVVQEMSNSEQCVTNCDVNICKIYRQVLKKLAFFIWSAEEESIEFKFKKICSNIPF